MGWYLIVLSSQITGRLMIKSRRIPTIEEYTKAVEGITLKKFAPSHKLLVN
ncbi:MAG: hypothetical protein NWQ47_04030 [Crocinitomicaceae bacterium]|nr:hypothetical protein [Crocinitomicaceae bacterium]MDP5010384.1 hypothetical protein [Crocinitomicaceae bacterium]